MSLSWNFHKQLKKVLNCQLFINILFLIDVLQGIVIQCHCHGTFTNLILSLQWGASLYIHNVNDEGQCSVFVCFCYCMDV